MSFGAFFRISAVHMHCCYRNAHLDQKIDCKLNFTVILSKRRVKNTVEYADFIFQKMAHQSYFVKIVLIMHNKCSPANIAHNSVNRSHHERHSQTN